MSADPSRWARAAVEHVDALCVGPPLDRSLRITLNFHPDRPAAPGDPVDILTALARDGVYRCQFETGTSNGGLTAYVGGDRWLWERSLFGGAYDDAPAGERPKYGALNHRGRPLGGAPRFGSGHLRLAEAVLDRATFCFPDSAFAPTRFATAHRFDLLRDAGEHDAALAADPDDPHRDPLDGYVEAQVHGRLTLADAEALVLDPCYRGTPVETRAATLPVPLEWHEGRVLTVDELRRHPSYRGPEAVAVGEAIAVDGRLDARIIGDAVRAGVHEPQRLKQVWHLTAMYGSPR